MLSDRGIRDAIAKERIIIDPFEPGPDTGSTTPNLGTCSYNLRVKHIYRIGRGATSADIPAYEKMGEFIDRYCEPYPGYFIDYADYIGVTNESLRCYCDPIVTDRSSTARIALEF